MMTKTEISRTDSITSRLTTYTVQRPAFVAGQKLGISIDRTGWADTTAAITLTLEISQDGGATWRHWCGYTDKGGPGLTTSEWSASAPPAKALVRVTASSNGKTVAQPFSLVEVK